MEENGEYVGIVPKTGISRIIGFLADAGYCGQDSDGRRPLNASDIKNFADLFDMKLARWEVVWIRRLSAEFCSAFFEFNGNLAAEQPFGLDEEEIQRMNMELERLTKD